MSTAVRSARQAKPLAPVNVEVDWIAQRDYRHLRLGTAMLAIKDVETGVEKLYFVKGLFEAGRLAGLKLTAMKPEEQTHADGYDVRFEGDRASCDCPDAIYRPHRPGGCRHVKGVCQALTQL